MKYLILVPDGAGDEIIEELNGKTPLEAADMPFINELAARGEVGMVTMFRRGLRREAMPQTFLLWVMILRYT